jgi:hypothetical protein
VLQRVAVRRAHHLVRRELTLCARVPLEGPACDALLVLEGVGERLVQRGAVAVSAGA